MEVILTGQSTKISTEIFQKNNFKVKYFRQLIRYRTEDGICPDCGNLNDSYELLQKLWKSPINE